MASRKLAHYTLLEKIGTGGMGDVYLAEDARLGRRVALKLLPESVSADPDRLARFEREARAVAALSHPNIVTIHSVERYEGTHFITMELVQGTTLGGIIPEGGMPFERFFEIAIPILDAIGFSHAAGIAHRDLKPDNIMISDAGHVKILDFGLAKPLAAVEPTGADQTMTAAAMQTRDGQILGTAAYMSPEQAEGKTVDHRSDIFSLGVILYELLTGQRPFIGDSTISTLSAILRDDPRPIAELRADVPAQLTRIVSRCLAKDPRERYQSALDVKNELADVQRQASGAPVARGPDWLFWAIPATMVLIALLFVWYHWGSAAREGSASSIPPPEIVAADSRPSIAVLPFVNMSDDPENEYFSDGISEEILNSLARLGGLRVVSRTSAFSMKGSELAIGAIADRLGVEHVLEGSVRRAGDRVRISAQLIEAADDSQLWSDRYERDIADIFRVQDEIAGQIVEALHLTLAPDERTALDEQDETAPEAYDLYLRARHLWHRRGTENLYRAIELFERAVELDPDFARGWSGMAMALSNVPAYDYSINYREAIPKIEAAANRARELDPALAEAFLPLADRPITERDWAGAIGMYRRALELEPGNPTGQFWLGQLMWRMGYLGEAMDLLLESYSSDPLYPPLISYVAETYLMLGERKHAATLVGRLDDFDSNLWGLPGSLLALERGDSEPSRRYIIPTLASYGVSREDAETVVAGFADAASRQAALAVLDHVGSEMIEGRVSAFNCYEIMEWYRLLGDTDRLFVLADGLAENGYASLENAFWGERHRDTRRHPRFKEIVRKRRLPEFWRVNGWPDECRPVGVDGFRCD